MTPRPTWSASGRAARGRPRGAAGRLGRGRRRDLRHRLRGRAAGAGGGGDRGDQPLRRAGRRLRHRLRRRRLERRGRGRGGRGRTSPSASTPPSSATGSPPASGTPASCGWRRSGSPTARPVEPVGRRDRPRGPRAGAAPRRRARPSSAPARWRSPAARAGLTGAVRMSSLAAIRAGAGYATVAVPADLEPIFESGQPEVMSVGCPGGDGCLAPASAKAVLRAFERAAAGVLGPGPRPRPGLGRAGPRGGRRRSRRRWCSTPTASTPSPATLERIAARAAPTVLTPHAGELGRLLGRDSERDRRPPPRLRPARRPRRPARSSSSRATTRSSPTASGSPSTRSRRPALATAGTGDVLSGIAAALLARGLEPFAAACAGGPRPRPRRARRRRADRRRRVGDRHRRDRLDPGRAASRQRAGRITSLHAMKTAAEIMDADVPAGHARTHDAPRAAIELLAKTELGAIPVVDERAQGGRHRQRVRPDPQRRGGRPAPAALPQHHGRDRLRRLDEGLRGAAQQGLRDQGLGADDRRPGRRHRRRRRRDRWRRRSPRSTTITCRWSTARAASPAWSPGPTRWPRSSTT